MSHLEQPGEAERGADGLSLELGLQALSVVLRIPITDLHLISVPEGLSRVAAVTPDQGNTIPQSDPVSVARYTPAWRLYPAPGGSPQRAELER